MSQFSEFLKKLEREVSSLSKKSGIRQLVSKNRRMLTGLAIGAATGGAGFLGLGAAGAIGAGVGLRRDKRKKEQEKRSLDFRRKLFARSAAEQKLAEEFPDPDDPDAPGDDEEELIGRPVDPPIDEPPIVEPPEDTGEEPIEPPPGTQPGEDDRFDKFKEDHPELFDPDGNFIGGDLDPDAPVQINDPRGGLQLGTDTGGQDEAKILAEAELARKLQLEQLGAKKSSRAASLKALSELLTQRGEREFSEISPQILEDLNSRGLLRSSALGDRFAKERGRIESRAQEQISLQSLQDRQTGLGESTGILDQFLGSRQSGLQRRFSLEDFNRQTRAAELLGQATSPITPFRSGGKGGVGDAAAIAPIVGGISQIGASKA